MAGVGFFGLAVSLLCAGVIVFSLFAGRVPARWPFPTFDRRGAPAGFWITLSIYAVGGIMGAVAASKFIDWKPSVWFPQF